MTGASLPFEPVEGACDPEGRIDFNDALAQLEQTLLKVCFRKLHRGPPHPKEGGGFDLCLPCFQTELLGEGRQFQFADISF